MLFKLSNLNSNLALTLCYLNPPLNNSAQVFTFKLLGVHLSDDLTWAVHCDYIVKKANRRLHALTQIRKCKVSSADIVHIYWALIRCILEYASATFVDLSKYLACYLENVQERAHSIIWPGIKYETAALDKAGADPGFFFRKPQVISGGGVRTPCTLPLDPPLQSCIIHSFWPSGSLVY